MGLNEWLFGKAQRTAQRWLAPRLSADLRGAAVGLPQVEGRLQLLAGIVAGREMQLLTAEDVGGQRGCVLYLPAEVAVAPDAEANLDLYRFRTALGATACRLGFSALPDLGQRDLASLLAVPATLAALEAVWPGAAPLRARVAQSLDARLPRGDPLAWLSRALLGGEAALAGCPERWLAWCRQALAAAPGPDGLAAVSATLAASLPPARGGDRSCLLPWGRLLPPTAAGSSDAAAPLGDVPTADALPRGTERRGKPREQVELTSVAKPSDGDNPLMHVFEKLFTAEEYTGGARRMDGADELDAHQDALDALQLRQLTRTTEAAASIYRADLELDGTAVELLDTGVAPAETLCYDEWDARRRRYRRGWCTLRAGPPPELPTAEVVQRRRAAVRQRYSRTIRSLRAELARLDLARRPARRQRSGEDVDVDALVQHLAAERAACQHGVYPEDDRLYIRQSRREPDLATLILIDSSLSTDAWVAGERVLDVARDAVLILGEVIGDRGLEVAIGGFYSNSRRDCHYVDVKSFATPWRRARSALLALQPTGYTRVGPALRHATSLLRRSRARHRLLLLISDGKATDYDRYEGRYGIADVRQALREAHRDGIDSFALAVQTSAARYLPRLFGRGGYQLLPKAQDLPRSVLEIYRRRWR